MRKKAISAVLAVIMSIMLMLTMTPATMEANAATDDGKVVDRSTINDWKNYFTEDSTESAGRVWTDKSVFENWNSLKGTGVLPNNFNGDSLRDEDFLVTLSALATNKEIIGYSTIPTDTVLILDVSQSMDNTKSVPSMIDAANMAIDRLLELNHNNRVGVVLYSGNSQSENSSSSTAMTLLPIDRYTPVKINNKNIYIQSTGSDGDTKVRVHNDLKTEDGKDVANNEKTTIGGTYIQNGIFQAMNVFKDIDDVVVGEGNIQAGVRRMPVMILMSDGAPTAGRTNYHSRGDSNLGNGTSTNADITFVTQLTAAYVKNEINKYYNSGASEEDKISAKFYTLGFNLDSTNDYADTVLNPQVSISAVSKYWRDLFSSRNGSITLATNTQGSQRKATVTRPTTNGTFTDGLTYDPSNMNPNGSQLYVDKAFEADGNNALDQAFKNIVNEIILQSAYYPTEVETGNINLDGYIKVMDELGMFMEVKNIHGILLNNKLYTGAAVTRMMQTSEFGDRNTFTALGWELVGSVAERLNASTDQVIDLLKNAWADGQLSYTSDTNFSNYIGWYESADGQYIKYWNDKHTEEDVPTNAKYISKSYLFYGSTEVNVASSGGDMMHIIVKVRTDIATGNQEVLFEIPASLIPVITYHIGLDTDRYETAKNITLEREERTPIMLLFEEGLRSDINQFNVDEKTANLTEEQHVHKNSDGSYYFYSNAWGHGKDETQLDPTLHTVAESEFHPSVENERYYYAEDSYVYVKNGNKYEIYNGQDPQSSSGEFYSYYRIFKRADGQVVIDQSDAAYDRISEVSITKAVKTNDGWIIPKGTVRQNLSSYRILKTGTEGNVNPTETLNYSMYAKTTMPQTEEHGYHINSFLGNNGRIKYIPATGIKLTKKVDNTLANYQGNYTFEVTIESAIDVDAKLTRENSETTLHFEAGNNGMAKAQVELAAGETVYITNLPAGSYTVKELVNDDYKVSNVTVNGTTDADKIANGTIKSTDIDKVVFTNTIVKKGDLVIRKAVTHGFASMPAGFADKTFTAVVTFNDAKGAPLAGRTFSTGANSSITTNNAGKVELTVKHGSAVTIQDIPEGVTYDVTEKGLTTGFSLVTDPSALTGTIVGDDTKAVTLVNNYVPAGLPDDYELNVDVVKEIDGINNWTNYTFGFQLEKLKSDDSWEKIGNVKNISAYNGTANFKIDKSHIDSVGTHTFRIVESSEQYGGITNDDPKYFSVVVEHDAINGRLAVASVNALGTQNVENPKVVVNSNTDVDIKFVNKHETTGRATISIPIEKHLVNNIGADIGLDGFVFELCKEGETTPIATATTNAAGEAVIHYTYDSQNIDDDENALTGNGIERMYTLKEAKGNVTNMIYSQQVYNVKVTLKSVNGQLTATSTVTGENNASALNSDGEVVFTNTFTIPDDNKTSIDLTAQKILDGYKVLKDNQFTFGVYKTGRDFAITNNSALLKTATNKANGTVSFGAIEQYSRVGTYHYVVKEIVPAEKAKGISYSNEEYYVTVTVGYENGQLTTNKIIVKPGQGEVDDMVFTNTYTPDPISVTVSGTKILEGDTLERGAFEFGLYDKESGALIDTVKNDGSGAFSFALDYDAADMNKEASKEFKYVVKEIIPGGAVNGKVNGIIYDQSQFDVVVNVTAAGTGELAATATITKAGETAEISFKNAYDPTPATVSIDAKKLLEGKDLSAGDYNFGVYKTDETYANSSDLVASGTNAEDGTIIFDGTPNTAAVDPFKIDTKGAHYYLVKELVPDNADINTYYDPTVYRMKVTVYGVGNHLNSTVEYSVHGVQANSIAFSNIYWMPSPTSVELPVGSKTLDGKALQDGQFGFDIYEADEQFQYDESDLLSSTKNNDGKIKFDDIAYQFDDLEGQSEAYFYYVIKETVPEGAVEDPATGKYVKKGVTFDNTEYAITIKLSNSSLGTLTAEVINVDVIGGSETPELEAVAFSNDYDEDNPIDPDIPDKDPFVENDEMVNTGDDFNALPFVAIALVAVIAAATVLFRRKK